MAKADEPFLFGALGLFSFQSVTLSSTCCLISLHKLALFFWSQDTLYMSYLLHLRMRAVKPYKSNERYAALSQKNEALTSEKKQTKIKGHAPFGAWLHDHYFFLRTSRGVMFPRKHIRVSPLVLKGHWITIRICVRGKRKDQREKWVIVGLWQMSKTYPPKKKLQSFQRLSEDVKKKTPVVAGQRKGRSAMDVAAQNQNQKYQQKQDMIEYPLWMKVERQPKTFLETNVTINLSGSHFCHSFRISWHRTS